ncbi:hypothetical protein [Arthrobacter sp. D5-1]|uniref:hypothetical protein n=1 Tax=Arthrobacter sp. D5-1 TaxID=1477518 RepID=UPI001A980D46|nr:hypothetical protein [Arthrobacter sp. D5-1]QSZ47247.1 hypothetical protein AYX22_01650 [Arthrobacter sp. D5-1]
MTEQLWAMGGVVAGILATGGTNVVVERVKVRQNAAEAKRATNRERCEIFLAAIEAEERAALDFYEQRGVLPGNAGHEETSAQARLQLTELELHCPVKLHKAATDLVDLLEGWAFGDKPISEYRAARKKFVSVFHQQL